MRITKIPTQTAVTIPCSLGDGTRGVIRGIGLGGMLIELPPGASLRPQLNFELSLSGGRVKFVATGSPVGAFSRPGATSVQVRFSSARLEPTG